MGGHRSTHETGYAIDFSDERTFLRAVALRRIQLRRARENYQKAVLEAREAGVSASAIARAAGVTESGIRLFVKRIKERES